MLQALEYDRNQYSVGYNQGYNKAIDEFVILLNERIEVGRCVDEQFAYIDKCDIDKIAEQMKGSAEWDW